MKADLIKNELAKFQLVKMSKYQYDIKRCLVLCDMNSFIG